ncbi:Uncharacterized protein BP5553_08262 [Venustampulla echinocandica]|uniref:DUF7730 domain-containing protein n=1 Tax=Venustampulla echinocandica TaxID=2656787 RepID=A0A370TG60_9HELO|nr:Uncharacterized protein BP5553_08262 [Venustampulla echinocandica]RDL33894.1 Uncharacterized protein BP5553_08262 [Venustampulla echinocandica]
MPPSDISNSGPSTSHQAPSPRRLDRLVITPATNNVKANNNVSFLSLPLEIRLQIYDLLLVSRYDPAQNPSWAVGNTHQKRIILDMDQSPEYRTMEPGILRTCKQIYHEANPILYSDNVFKIGGAEYMFRFIVRVGPVNIQFVKSIYIWVHWLSDLHPWLQLFPILAKEATGLRNVEFEWGANREFPWHLKRGVKETGLGDKLHFLRTLGIIQGRENLATNGYYAMDWPAYLERSMALGVRAVCGDCRDEGCLSDEESKDREFILALNETEMENLRTRFPFNR